MGCGCGGQKLRQRTSNTQRSAYVPANANVARPSPTSNVQSHAPTRQIVQSASLQQRRAASGRRQV